MEETKNVIYCGECGKENEADAIICIHCNKKIKKHHSPFTEFLTSHTKSELEGKITDSVFNLIRKFVFSHLYGTILTVSIIATVAVSAATATPYIEPVSEPAPSPIEKPETELEPEEEPEPEPEEEELSKESPICEFLGKTVGDVKRIWGSNYETGIFEGGDYYLYSDKGIAFYTPHMNYVSDNQQIKNVSAYEDISLYKNIRSMMTFSELQAAVPEITLIMPQKEYSEYDGEWGYFLSFDYEGKSFMFTWYDDPATNLPASVMVKI